MFGVCAGMGPDCGGKEFHGGWWSMQMGVGQVGEVRGTLKSILLVSSAPMDEWKKTLSPEKKKIFVDFFFCTPKRLFFTKFYFWNKYNSDTRASRRNSTYATNSGPLKIFFPSQNISMAVPWRN